MTSTNFDVHDLDWAAYCYAAGELPAAETERFEALLLESQAAREAVARAVELTEMVVAAGPAAVTLSAAPGLEPATPTALAWVRIAGWLSLATAASLALVMFGRQPTEIASRGPIAPTVADGPALERLTEAWIANRTDGRTDGDAEFEADHDLADLSSLDELAPEGADDAEFSAPSWLTTAVTGAEVAPQSHQE